MFGLDNDMELPQATDETKSKATFAASDGSAKIYGVTHRGTDGETKAYMEDGRVWISDGGGGWFRCNPGVEGYFSPNEKGQP